VQNVTIHFPKVYFCGDVHGQFDQLCEVVLRDRPDAIILLGDLELTRPLEVELAPILGSTTVRFIHGNHDTDSDAAHRFLFQSPTSAWNLHGKVETICGVRIAGLGGVFRGKTWMPPNSPQYAAYPQFIQSLANRRPIRERQTREGTLSRQERLHCSSIFPSDVTWLASQRADILVCHEAPSCHANGFPVIDALAATMGVTTVYHGHHHQTHCYPAAPRGLGFRVFGVGLRSVVALDGRTVLH
jgi:predicted phosphodiesterase